MNEREVGRVLVELLTRKKENLLEMKQLTKLQSSNILEKDGEGLAELTDHKQPLMDEIDKIDLEFLRQMEILKKIVDVSDLSQLPRSKAFPELSIMKTLVGEIQELLKDLTVLDEQNKKALSDRMKGIKVEIRKLEQGKMGIQAYGGKITPPGGVYFDRKK